MIDWILAGALRAQLDSAVRTAEVAHLQRVAVRQEEQAAADEEAEREAERARADALRREAEAAMAALPMIVDGRPMPVRVTPPVSLFPNPLGTGGGGLPWRTDGYGRDARSQTDLAPAGDAGTLGDGGGTYAPGSTASGSTWNGVTITPFRQIWNGQVLSFYEVSMSTATGFNERFMLFVPRPNASPQVPLLTVFHKFGSTHWDVWYNTTFLQECLDRGWFLVCPLAASNKSFSSPEAQANREAVFDWVLGAFGRVDRERVYGVGFSMGGGACLNYAARHLDPAHFTYAALINHSGGVDLNHTYASDPPAQYIFDFWFGDGTPGSADPWKMAQSSVLRFDPLTEVVQPDWDLARQLVGIPLRTVRASNDAIPYLSVQNDVLNDHMHALGAGPQNDYGYYVLPYTGHSWDMLDETAACDFLGDFARATPTSARILADRDAVYYDFAVVQEAGGAFTPFAYDVDLAANRLTVSETANLAELVVDTPATGLDFAQALTVDLSTADGLADTIVLRHWPQAPAGVQRDGFADVSWSYDPATAELTLIEYDGGSHSWTIQP